MPITVAVPLERTQSERRVALDPSRVERLLLNPAIDIRIEAECGHAAGFHDEDYEGVMVCESFAETVADADIITKVKPPTLEEVHALPEGSILIAIMSAFQHLDVVAALKAKRITVIAMDQLPRITRAQPMDALSSQATVAGYKAALLAAELSPRMFPMLTTAAGTIRPSRVLVIGAGVAGLQAIATARRLGAKVDAYDIRAAAKEQIESLGARMIDTGVEVEGAGGFARALRRDEKQKQHDVLAEHLAQAHAVICAASIPGKKAPLIITEDMVDGMLPDTVIIDMTAETGGNCELTRAGEHVHHNDTLIVGPLNLPSNGAVHASEMYARNVHSMMQLFVKDDAITLDPDDEIVAHAILMHDGEINHVPTAKLLDVEPVAFGAVPASGASNESDGWLRESPEPEPVSSAKSEESRSAEPRTDDSAQSSANAVSSTVVSSGIASEVDTDEHLDKEPNFGAGSRSVTASTAVEDTNISATSMNASVNDAYMSDSELSESLADPDPDIQDIEDLQRLDGVSGSDIDAAAENAPAIYDDLTRIEGIGPAMQERLYSFGYSRWQQLAELNTETAKTLSAHLEIEETVIEEQAWGEQARALMEQGA